MHEEVIISFNYEETLKIFAIFLTNIFIVSSQSDEIITSEHPSDVFQHQNFALKAPKKNLQNQGAANELVKYKLENALVFLKIIFFPRKETVDIV